MRILILLVSVLILSPTGFAADDSNSKVITIDKKEYTVKVSCTSEDRSLKTDGYANVKVQIEGLQAGWVFTKIEIDEAVDDTGKDLIREKVKKIDDDLKIFSENEERYFTFWLKQSNREAKIIKDIKGTLYLQNASAGKPCIIPDFRKTAGEYIKNDELKEQGIKIAYINKETFDEKGSKLIMDALFPNSVKRDDSNIKNSLAQMKVSCTQANLVSLIIEDPEQEILKVEALDPKTKKTVKSITSFKSLVMIPVNMDYSLKDEKPNYTDLQIFLKDKQPLQKVSFKFENIKLP